MADEGRRKMEEGKVLSLTRLADSLQAKRTSSSGADFS